MENIPYVSKIESMGWSLYDVSTHELHMESWERRNARLPVSEVIKSHTYLFAPQKAEGESLIEVYAKTGGLGPCLRISDVQSPEYTTLALRFSPRFAVFTRFTIHNSEVILHSPRTIENPESDMVVLSTETALTTFERDFDIIEREEFEEEVISVRQYLNNKIS